MGTSAPKRRKSAFAPGITKNATVVLGVAGDSGQPRRINAHIGKNPIVLALDIRVEKQLLRRLAGEPAIIGDLGLELTRSPTGITQSHQGFARSTATRDGTQYIHSSRQANLFCDRHR